VLKVEDFENSQEWNKVIKFLKKEWPITQEMTEFKTLKDYIIFEIKDVPRAKREWEQLSIEEQNFF